MESVLLLRGVASFFYDIEYVLFRKMNFTGSPSGWPGGIA